MRIWTPYFGRGKQKTHENRINKRGIKGKKDGGEEKQNSSVPLSLNFFNVGPISKIEAASTWGILSIGFSSTRKCCINSFDK